MRWYILICMITLGTLRLYAAQGSPELYVVNALSEDISVIDTKTNENIGTIPLGMPGYQIAVDPACNGALVTAIPQQQKGQQQPGQLIKVDLQARKVMGSIPLALAPLSQVFIHPDGKMAYVVTAAPPGARNEERGQVLFVDLVTETVAQTVPIGLNPLGSAMTCDGARLFTADWASRSISVVDLTNRKLQDTLPLGLATTRALAITPDGRMLYAILERPLSVAGVPVNNGNAAYNMLQNNAQVRAFPVEDKLFWEIDTISGAVNKYGLEYFTTVYALAVSPDASSLFAYGRVKEPAQSQQADSMQQVQQIAAAEYDLVRISLKDKRIVKRYGNYGFIPAIAVSADGQQIYLIGTPGDPKKEARAQQAFNQTVTKAAQRDDKEQKLNDADITDVIENLRRLAKTITVLDAKTGQRIKTITIGSLPQGYSLPPLPTKQNNK